ncbi:hypothetical protein TOPH_09029 [Tolypocladium ophioglossoides CBS 100239]|uniref:Uncharacterized protein n=1 Tax=Tolypocladium ophioglossoides (strain CBS 100239) TaxID=1163406 RepID=A0A0L0MX31_TOLOC|nr:hypothetical protein TOPH_09029 [Tolypocladium ophioglossoides CBS 100239]
MSRITAPVSKLSRALSSSSNPVARAVSPLHDSSAHNAGAVLMPKYAELLRSRRSSEHSDASLPSCCALLELSNSSRQSSRGLTTAHRPTPQPSLANRSRPLMQTFYSTTPSTAMHTSSTHLDAAVIPSMRDLTGPSPADAGPRVPLLPDNYSAAHGPTGSDVPVQIPEISIVAANPENVVPATPLSEVQGISLDGVELKFVHEDQHYRSEEESGSGIIRDLWKGMVEDVLGPAKKSS